MISEKQIKHILIEENLTMKELAEKLGTSPQNLSQKLKRETIRYKEMIEIAELLNYKITWEKQ